MQISNQVIQVNHQFEAVQERKITAVENAIQASKVATTAVPASSVPEQDQAYHVTLTPEQEVQKKLIENISDKKMLPYIEQQYHGRLSLNFESETHQQTFKLQGYQVTDSSVLTVSEKRYEYEQLDYSTTLQITDANGSLASHSFSLSYARELSIELQLSITAAEFKDPLVLNIGQKSALFSKDKKLFDLDADGQKESIPELTDGLWYLAYDRNQNGRIDSGLELFGAQTGQGFAELADFDTNNNALIESSDEQFNQLSLWNGKQSMQSLDEGGIKAISLNATNTPFTFTDSLGKATAQIRQTSVFLTDKDTLGAIHQVDIAV